MWLFTIITLLWAAPTQNEDGTAYTDAAGYVIYESTVSGGPYTEVVTINDPAILSYVLDRPVGTWYFVATAFNQQDIESGYSGEATRIVEAAPLPPDNFQTTGNLFAYGLSQTSDVLRLIPVGTVIPGVPCDFSMTVNGMYLVPKAEVAYIGSARPTTVFAECVGSGN